MRSEWKLVPTIPTDDMIVAFAEAWYSKRQAIDDPDMLDAYRDMLAVAPQPPALGGEPEVLACAVFAKNGNIRCWSQDCTAVGLKVSAEEGSPIIELIDRAHVAPLLAEIERLAFQSHCHLQRAQLAEKERDTLKARCEALEAALKFYADREHYHFESGNWDTVSGEPMNILWCGDEPDFIEDGSVARIALAAPAAANDQQEGRIQCRSCYGFGTKPIRLPGEYETDYRNRCKAALAAKDGAQ